MSRFAFRIGRRIGKHPIAGWLFCVTERTLPMKRIARENGLVAFHHPRPIADPHVLIVPIQPVSSLTTERMSDEDKSKLLWAMAGLARRLSTQFPASSTWQLVINGGTRQDIGQLHGHLLHSDGRPQVQRQELCSPEADPSTWLALFQKLYKADRAHDNDFSLIFVWSSERPMEVEVTQSGVT